MVAPAVAAAGIGAASSILGSIFGRSSARKARRRADAREDSRFQRATKDAKAAGLHPLFALGAAGAGSPSFISGQSETGALDRDAINKVGGFVNAKVQDSLRDKTNLITAQAALSAVELARHTTSNDGLQQMTLPSHRPAFQEIQKGRTDAHFTKNPEQSLNIKSPMTQVRMGSQMVWVPVEEMDEFMENPLAVGGLTYAYHGNKNVDWKKLFMEYTGRKPTKSWLDQVKDYSRGRVKARQERLRKYGSVDRQKAIDKTFFGRR